MLYVRIYAMRILASFHASIQCKTRGYTNVSKLRVNMLLYEMMSAYLQVFQLKFITIQKEKEKCRGLHSHIGEL